MRKTRHIIFYYLVLIIFSLNNCCIVFSQEQPEGEQEGLMPPPLPIEEADDATLEPASPNVKPAEATPTNGKSKTKPKSDKVSLELKNIDVVEVIKILSRKGNINIVVGPNVKGRVTMFLTDVGFMEALEAVLESASLAYVDKGGIMQIMTDKEFETAFGRPFYDNRTFTVIPIKNASASDIASALSKVKPQAIIVVDERTNSLLIKDSNKNIADMKKAIEEMDKKIIAKSIKIKFLTQKQLDELIKLILSAKGAYYYNAKINQIVIKDYPENVDKIVTLLQVHDIPTQIITKAYELDYAKYDALEAKLKLILTPDIGSTIADERTNKLLVSDVEANFEKIDKMVFEYDVKDRQVLIESKIVQVLLNDQFKWGINWHSVIQQLNDTTLGLNVTSAYDIGADVTKAITFAKSVDEISKVPTVATPDTDTTTSTYTTDVDEDGLETSTNNTVRTVTQTNETTDSEDIPFNSNILYPKEGGARIVALGQIEGHQFEGVLNALKMVGDTKVLSSPRIITLNNEEAKIQVASKEAYVTSTTVTPGTGPATTSENVTFIDVGITLAVTPIINKNDFITMKVKPSVSQVTSTIQTATGNTIPIVSTQEIESKIQVKDGVTIVLGGLHEQFRKKNQNRIPFLGAIPLIGLLFKKIDNQVKNSELIMFLTPRILSGEKSFYEEGQPDIVAKEIKDFIKEEKVYDKAKEYEKSKALKQNEDDIME